MCFPASRSIKRAATPSRDARGVLSRASRAAISTWWACRWRGCTGCWGNWVGRLQACKHEYPRKNKKPQSSGAAKKDGPLERAAGKFQGKRSSRIFEDYFFSGGAGATGGGVCGGGTGGGGRSRM